MIFIRGYSLFQPIVAFAIFQMSGYSFGDASFEYETTTNEGAVLETASYQIKGGQLRYSMNASLSASEEYYLYTSQPEQLLFVQPHLDTHYILSEGVITAATDQIKIQKTQLEDLLANGLNESSSSTRDSVKEALRNLELVSSQLEIYQAQLGSKSVQLKNKTADLTINGYSCAGYSVSLLSALLEVCYANAESLGISQSELETFTSFHKALHKASGMPEYYTLIPAALPVMVVHGSVDSPTGLSTSLGKIITTEIDSSIFTITESSVRRDELSAP
jgi:hypothetical protein